MPYYILYVGTAVDNDHTLQDDDDLAAVSYSRLCFTHRISRVRAMLS